MLKSFLIAFSAVASVTLSLVGEANAFGTASAARAMAPRPADMKPAGPKLGHAPPLQFQIFCLQNPADCRRTRLTSIAYDERTRHLLAEINNQVNSQIKPRADKGRDVWTISSTFGDCDDYAITKRHKLIRAGLPASALRMAVVRTPKGEGHAVLVVKTSAGEFVLDNLRSMIVSRQESGYRYLTVASDDPHRWKG
ncbi:putative transglutaminase-like cysteine proteinase [Rhizobium aquaticum]|uniref:Transglutaminase-like cysteine proteinase n=1 Tax=Rhizobium aquaticum TaxID=1549636 RepID=A0ABV2J0Z6_9HYPH